MGQVLHGSATTTEAVRQAIQHSQEDAQPMVDPGVAAPGPYQFLQDEVVT